MSTQKPVSPPVKIIDPETAFRQGVAHHEQRRLLEAERCFEIALKANNRHFGSLYHLGMLRLQQRRLDDAVELYRRALQVDKNSYATHHHIAIALAGLERGSEAVQHCEKALAINPALAETRNNLGHALQCLGRLDEAVVQYEKAITIKPNYVEALNNLGNALHLLERSEDAIPHYERALAIRPQFAEAHTNLGNVLVKLGKFDDGIAHYRKAIAINPRDVEALDSLARTLFLLERADEAIAFWDRVVAIEPSYDAAHAERGRALEELGRLDDAIQSYEKAIVAAPRKSGPYLAYVKAKRIVADNPHLSSMIVLAKDIESLPEFQQIELHFALGKAFGDIGNYQESFWHMLCGNQLKRKEVDYDERKVLDRFARTQRTFTSELLHRKRGLGDPSSLPIFIIGMPRSGTTLIEQILASHPKVHGAGELPALGELMQKIDELAGIEFPEGTERISDAQLRELGAFYSDGIVRLAPAKAERVTDKMPTNFMLAGLIPLVLPNARIIHVRRDPCDVALSCYSILFANGQDHTYDLAELGRYIRGYQSLMAHWRKVIPSDVMIEVQYEEVVGNLEQEARRVVAHCGLDWDEACLDFHKTERLVRTASLSQVRQPIYTSSVGRWRRYEDQLQPLVEALEGP